MLKSISFNRRYMDMKCTIYTITNATIKGSQIDQKSSLYSLIKCGYWRNTANQENFKERKLVIEQDVDKVAVSISPQYTGVRRGMYIEVFYIDNGSNISIGDFTIDSVENYNADSVGGIDHFLLQCSKVV